MPNRLNADSDSCLHMCLKSRFDRTKSPHHGVGLPQPSQGPIVKRGRLTRRGGLGDKKGLEVWLTAPRTTVDINIIYTELMLDPEAQRIAPIESDNWTTNEGVRMLGNIAAAAMIPCPLLVMGKPRTFIPFNRILGLYGEEDLGQACNFTIIAEGVGELRFAVDT